MARATCHSIETASANKDRPSSSRPVLNLNLLLLLTLVARTEKVAKRNLEIAIQDDIYPRI